MLLCLFTVAASSDCGPRLVTRTDDTAIRFAADSAAIMSLQRDIVNIRAQCREDSLRAATERAATPVRSSAPPVSDSLVKARDTEIATLRDQLTRANAELERIKRRLANPRS